jgi:hypothetical protein
MLVGTPQRRDSLCRTFIETYRAFEPESLPWPRLELHYVDLLRAFAFWSLALGIEQKAGRMLSIFGQTTGDP